MSAGLFALTLGMSAWAEGSGRDLTGVAAGFLPAFAFVMIFTRVAVREKRTREHAEELAAELREANERRHEAARRTEELAAARERNRLVREIPDSLGHYLTTVAVQLEAARALGSVGKAHGLVREALVEVRRSVGLMRAEGQARPLVERLRELAEGEAGVAVEVRVRGEARRLGPEEEHGLFRAAQEGLTNVRKHASARAAAVTVEFGAADRVSLSGARSCCRSRGNLCSSPLGVTVLTAYDAFTGVRCLFQKNAVAGNARGRWLDWLATAGAGAFGVALMGYGLLSPKPDVTLAVPGVIFGGLILVPVGQDVWRFFRPSGDPKWWWYYHLERMIGSYIGAVTAFMVNQVGPRVPASMQIFVWIGPALVLAPVIVLWKAYYRRKFAPTAEAAGRAIA